MDQNRLDAMKKLEELKKSAITSQEAAESPADRSLRCTSQRYKSKIPDKRVSENIADGGYSKCRFDTC